MYILVGLVIGFVAAIPLGPVNVFVISQALKRDFFHGFLAGMTTAFLDAVFCFVALAGILHFDIPPDSRVNALLKILTAAILAAVAVRLYLTSRKFVLPAPGGKVPPAAARPIIGVLLLYVTNPSIYAFWFAVAGSMNAHQLVVAEGWPAALFALSCGAGAVLWYLLLVRFVCSRQGRITARTFKRLLLGLAVLFLCFAVYTAFSIWL